MSNIFKNIKYYLLSLKEKNLREKLKNTTKTSFSNKTSKTIIGSGSNLTLNSETKKLIESVRENVYAIVKQVDCNPEKLLEYIKAANTPVYKINNADKILALLKEEEGLITEQHGLMALYLFMALYLSICVGRGFSLKTPPMFVMREGVIDKYYMLHHFYRWYSLKSDLPGFEYEVQQKFKRFLIDNSPSAIRKFSMEDIISLKEAIARDQEATDFVLKYTKSVDGSKNVLDKIKNEGGASV
ncbi:unknown [Clostridium sp. CAG:813]|nr:unknown [Clostridium sp. CAG:813]